MAIECQCGVVCARLVAKQREPRRVVRLVGRKWLRESNVDKVVGGNIKDVRGDSSSTSLGEEEYSECVITLCRV